MYTALVLNQASATKLQNQFKDMIPTNWQIYCHHMTINIGGISSGPIETSGYNAGETEQLTVVAWAKDDKVMAVKVTSGVPSTNTTKHITVAVNVENGGKPFLSNKLTNWIEISPLVLSGTIEEVN